MATVLRFQILKHLFWKNYALVLLHKIHRQEPEKRNVDF